MASPDNHWAWLPRNLLFSILEKVQFSDYLRLSGVCRQWRHNALDYTTDDYMQKLRILKACHNKLPVLMIDTEKNHESKKRLLFSVTEGITYEVQLPIPCNSRFFGSSFGWLFAIEERTMIITLLNPFTCVVVSFPPFKDPDGEYEYHLDDPADCFIVKAILSTDPFQSPNNYEVMVIYGGMHQLAHIKYGEDSWNFIHNDKLFVFSDVIYYGKSQVYALNYWREIVKIDLTSGTETVLTKRSTVFAHVTYVVQSQEGDLLMVRRFWNNKFKKTKRFLVFKLVHPIEETEAKWVRTKSLGDQALFLGENHSTSVSTLEFNGCLPNCIYYTQHFHDFIPPYVCQGINEDSGIFNLEEGSFRSHYILDPFEKNMLPPICLCLI